jgi:malate dehydrogenase (oxaloacetate-decarboxylating)
VRVEPAHKVRDVTILATDEAHIERVAAAVDAVEVQAVSDRTFISHLGGTLEMRSRVPLKTRDDLSMA